MKNLRFLAGETINEITNGRSLKDALEPRLKQIKEVRDRAFLKALVYGTCRFYIRIDVILSHLLKKPMRAKDRFLHALLMIGLYQLIFMRIPAHAALSETVSAAKEKWAKNLLNAVLRTYLREKEKLAEVIEQDEEAKWNHPAWIIKMLKEAYPTEWQKILLANDAHPPFSLRVNQQKISRDSYLEKLAAAEISAQKLSAVTHGVLIKEALGTELLPGFLTGEVSVQDGAAQLAAFLLAPKANELILDAAAAPGGKLTHLLEIEPHAKIIAVEKDAQRLQLIKENLARLNLDATCICADASETETWWNQQLFDKILLDAPCSASGVIRRHPDIKLLREAKDISELARTQLHLLFSLWPLLKPGGILLYATCSIFPEENENVIQKFLSDEASAKEKKIIAEWGEAKKYGRQILPGMQEMDGFYYALLEKKNAAGE